MGWFDTKHSPGLWHNDIASKRALRFDRPMTRQNRADRGRSLAEMVEGVSSRHDQQRFGTGPFGRLTLGSFFGRRR